jgi:murein DD-endopeptidase MepM/ murein hydrolase activator NlpD
MLNAETQENLSTNFGIGGPSNEPDDLGIYYPPTDLNVAYNKIGSKLDNLEVALKKQEAGLVELYELMQERNAILSSTPSIWPTRGWITSGFGYRIYPFTGETKFHEGIDISTRVGTDVVATADGIVAETGYDITYGNNIIIDHGFGYVTRYGHLSRINVKTGEMVKRGQKIGEVGNTGFSTGPHLHYEIKINGVPVNPEHYILN